MKKLVLFIALILFAKLSWAGNNVRGAYARVEQENGLNCKFLVYVTARDSSQLPGAITGTIREAVSGNIVGNIQLYRSQVVADSILSPSFKEYLFVYESISSIPTYNMMYSMEGSICCVLSPDGSVQSGSNCPATTTPVSYLPKVVFKLKQGGSFKSSKPILVPYYRGYIDSISGSSYSCLSEVGNRLRYSLIPAQISNSCSYSIFGIIEVDSLTGIVYSKPSAILSFFYIGVKVEEFDSSGKIGEMTISTAGGKAIHLTAPPYYWLKFRSTTDPIVQGQIKKSITWGVPYHLAMTGVNMDSIYMTVMSRGELFSKTSNAPVVAANSINRNGKYTLTYDFYWTPQKSDVRPKSYYNVIRLFDTIQPRINNYDLGLELTVVNGVGTESIDPYSEFLPVYPNPSTGALFVPFMLRKPSGVIVRFYDAVGRVAKTENLGNQPMGRNEIGMVVSDLTNGYYIMEVVTQSGELVNRQKVQVKQ